MLRLTFSRFIFLRYPLQIGLPLLKLAMELLFFQIFALTVEIVFNLTPNEDEVSPALKVAHSDCREMTENTLDAINQVRPCHTTPEELEISKAKVVLYTKFFRKELNATKCRVKHKREKWHLGHHDHISIDHTIAGITKDFVISPERCRTSAKGKDITLLGNSISFGFDTKNAILKTFGDNSDDYRSECDGRGWINRDTFLPHMQTTTLKITLERRKVLSDTVLILPCPLEELGCETTSLDPYAYIWVYSDNCAISMLRTEEVNMLKQGEKYYVIIGADSSSKFVFEVKNNPQEHCGKPTSIYSTNYESLYMDRLSEGSDLDSRRNLGLDQHGATKIVQYLGPKEKCDFGQFHAHNPK